MNIGILVYWALGIGVFALALAGYRATYHRSRRGPWILTGGGVVGLFIYVGLGAESSWLHAIPIGLLCWGLFIVGFVQHWVRRAQDQERIDQFIQPSAEVLERQAMNRYLQPRVRYRKKGRRRKGR